MSVIARLASNKIAKNTSALMLAQMASRLLGVLYIGALARYVGTQ
jgi:O-antigen/teichoic acid export membrane protein